MNIPTDQQVLHVLTQEFMVDGQEDIREPIGMSGVRLEVRVHIVTGAVSAAQNIIKCVRRCGLEVQDLILQPLASSMSVLSEDEKELGVAMIDIGGGTTDIAIFTGGASSGAALGRNRPGFVSNCSRNTPSRVIFALICRSAEHDTPIPIGHEAACRGIRITRTSCAKYFPPN